jgi:hypothetical protein
LTARLIRIVTMLNVSTTLIRPVCIVSALIVASLVNGCATQAEHGNLEQFILGKVQENGGVHREVDQAAPLMGRWTFFDDRYGTFIRSHDITFAQVA